MLSLADASSGMRVAGIDPLITKVHDFSGPEAQWKANLRTFDAVGLSGSLARDRRALSLCEQTA